MKIGQPTCVIFDVDGTLASNSNSHLDALFEVASKHLQVPVDFETVHNSILLNGEPVDGWVDAQVFYHLNPNMSEFELQTLVRLYTDSYTKLVENGASAGVLLDGAEKLLTALKASEVHTALATGNAAQVAQAKLAKLGVDNYFKFNPRHGFGDYAPNRESLVQAAVKAIPNDMKGSIMLVGDTISDMEAAKASNVFAVGVTTGVASFEELQTAGADAVFSNLNQFLSALDLPTCWTCGVYDAYGKCRSCEMGLYRFIQ